MTLTLRTALLFRALTLAGVFTYPAAACSCLVVSSPCASYREASAVFLGEVTSISRASSEELAVRFRVDEVMKGKLGSTVTIKTSAFTTGCGFRFSPRKSYLVYAYSLQRSDPTLLTTGICTGTKLREAAPIDELEVLRSLQQGVFRPRIFGQVVELLGGISPLPLRETSPVRAVQVTLQKGAENRSTITDESGSFRFTNLRPGNYRIRPVPPQTYKVGGDYWEDPTGESREFTEARVEDSGCPGAIRLMIRIDGRISGCVRDHTGAPVPSGTRMTLVPATVGNSHDSNVAYIPAYTGIDGCYEFRGLPEGEYLLGINLDTEPHRQNPYPKTYYSIQKEPEKPTVIGLQRGGTLTGFDLKLPAPLELRTVSGRAVWDSGSPAKNALVFVARTTSSEFNDLLRVRTDEHGRFSVPCLKGLRYSISAQGVDGESAMTAETEVVVEEELAPLLLVLKRTRE